MNSFFSELKTRNELLYWFGIINLLVALLSMFLILVSDKQILGINAWIKPFKFFLSTAIFVFTMSWFMHYLQEERKVTVYSWVVIAVFVFENVYIFWQAAKGELSHFNINSQFHGKMFMLMGIAISFMTLWTAYITFLFFQKSFPELPIAYVWGIRLGLVLFVFFAFSGGIMAAKLSHNVGGEMIASKGLPLLNWSKQFGDLRVAHFFGMHALQILPLIGFYISKTKSSIIIISVVYATLVTASLLQALNGKPLIKL